MVRRNIMKPEDFITLFDNFLNMVDEIKFENASMLRLDCEKSKPNILRNYSDLNFYVKGAYMRNSSQEIPRLDRHKCAACFMIAILNELDLTITNYKSPLIKEKIAALAGLGILHFFITCDNRNLKDVGFATFIKEKDFVFPANVGDKNEYMKNWTLELFHSFKENRTFILSLSNELFLIEQHNRQIFETLKTEEL